MFQAQSRKSRYRWQSYLLVVSFVWLVSAIFVTVCSPTVQAHSADRRVIVQLKSGTNLSRFVQTYNARPVRILEGRATYLIESINGESADDLVARMANDTQKVYAEANYNASRMAANPYLMYGDPYLMYGDPYLMYGDSAIMQYALNKAKNQWAFQNIRLPQAHAVSKGRGIKVAVVDSGVFVGHPHLAGKILPGRNTIAYNSDVTDETGHGTFVAGIIGLVAPEAKIIPVKVLGADNRGSIGATAAGIRWAADSGAHIINVSLGTYYRSWELDEAVRYAREKKGALVIASVGNDNSTNQRFPGSSEKAFSVAATTERNRKADFSNYGQDSWVRVVAPGVDIYSLSHKGGYMYGSGTSFSTPIVAGIAALVWASEPEWDNENVKSQIESKVTKLDKCDTTYGQQLGQGLVDAHFALTGDERTDKESFSCQGETNGNDM
jgi:subtilisin family serine protease